jgi:hypothetical protein
MSNNLVHLRHLEDLEQLRNIIKCEAIVYTNALTMHEFLYGRLGQHLGARRQRQRQLLRAAKPLRRFREKGGQDPGNCLRLLGVDLDRPRFNVSRRRQRLAAQHLAGGINADELEIVGDKDVAGQRPVFGDLRRLQNLVEILADGFHLDIAKYHAVALDLEVRRALVALAPALMLHLNARLQGVGFERVEQIFQRRAPRMLRAAFAVTGGERFEVSVEAVVHDSPGVAQTMPPATTACKMPNGGGGPLVLLHSSSFAGWGALS